MTKSPEKVVKIIKFSISAYCGAICALNKSCRSLKLSASYWNTLVSTSPCLLLLLLKNKVPNALLVQYSQCNTFWTFFFKKYPCFATLPLSVRKTLYSYERWRTFQSEDSLLLHWTAEESVMSGTCF